MTKFMLMGAGGRAGGGGGPTPEVVYDEAYNSAVRTWTEDTYSATSTPGSTDQAHAGTKSIKLDVTSAWGMYGANCSPYVTYTSFTKFTFWVYPNVTGSIRVQLRNSSGIVFSDWNAGSKTGATWSKIEYIFSDRSVNANIRYINVGWYSSSTNDMYLDDLQFE